MPRMLDTLEADLTALDTRPVTPQLQRPAVEQPVRWRLRTRVAFRFFALYFGLYVLTTQMLGGLLPLVAQFLPNLGATGWLKGIVGWTATHVFHASGFVTVITGSGDKTIDWVHAFCLLVVAGVTTVLWSAVDRRRPNYATAHKWFHLFLRFAVGSTMVGYGMVKAFPLQMPAPSLQRLLEPFGDFSPMGVLWYSIGASRGYEMFAGFTELTGAVLLFVPRLRILGAMVTLAASIQIFTLNMTYDVPVKLFSFHLIVMCLFLLAPEAPRLMRVLVLNKTAGPSSQPPLLRSLRGQRIMFAAQLLFGAYILAVNFSQAWDAWAFRGGGAAKPPLYGIWDVASMRVDGVERAPLVIDYGRWRRVVIQNASSITFQRMDNTFQVYAAKFDMDAKSMALTNAADKNWSAKLAFDRPDNGDRMVIDGDMDGHKVRFDLRRMDHTKMLLLTRGFSWVQERPFNR
jgi:hypothetical protein